MSALSNIPVILKLKLDLQQTTKSKTLPVISKSGRLLKNVSHDGNVI